MHTRVLLFCCASSAAVLFAPDLFFFIFNFSHFYVVSMCLMRRLRFALPCASSLDNSLSFKSFLMLSNHLRFGLPVLLFPGTSIAITLFPTYSSSLLNTCPYHFNLLSCTFLDISPTLVVPLFAPNSYRQTKMADSSVTLLYKHTCSGSRMFWCRVITHNHIILQQYRHASSCISGSSST